MVPQDTPSWDSPYDVMRPVMWGVMRGVMFGVIGGGGGFAPVINNAYITEDSAFYYITEDGSQYYIIET
jgi:hypothetical protein